VRALGLGRPAEAISRSAFAESAQRIVTESRLAQGLTPRVSTGPALSRIAVLLGAVLKAHPSSDIAISSVKAAAKPRPLKRAPLPVRPRITALAPRPGRDEQAGQKADAGALR